MSIPNYIKEVIKPIDVEKVQAAIDQFVDTVSEQGIEFDPKGYPVFDNIALAIVKTNGLKGNFCEDFYFADEILGIDRIFREKNQLSWIHGSRGNMIYLLPDSVVFPYTRLRFTTRTGAANILHYFSTVRKKI